MTSRATSDSFAPRPRSLAVSALAALASRISSARCEGGSLRATAPGLILPAEGAWAGAALAAPDWTAAVSRAATPTRATPATRRLAVWEVRLWEELLLNTDSFCVAAGHTARGDRTEGDPSGHNREVRRNRCMGWSG